MCIYIIIYVYNYILLYTCTVYTYTYRTSMAGQAECCYLGVKNMGIPGEVSLAQFMCSIYDFDGEWTVAGIVVAFNFHWMLHGINTLHIWFLVWNIFYCSIYWECHHPN